MIGAWRWFLALLVVVGHLYTPWWPASFAVFSFYIISGFLMTLIMNEHYNYSLEGIKAFWINRFLRLYPAYYIACLFSLMLTLWIPSEFITKINNKLIYPHSLFEIVTNISILGLQQVPNRSSLVPAAWALSIEIFYYIVISLWAGKSKIHAFIFFCLSLLYLVLCYLTNHFDLRYRYFYLGAGALPFAVGANIYFYRGQLQTFISKFSWHNALLASLTLYVLVFVGGFLYGENDSVFFYPNILTTSILLVVLWNAPDKFKEIDSFLGDLSYPTYLFHWQICVLVVYISGFSFKSWEVFALSTLLVTVLSVIEAKTVTGSIEKYRKKIKRKFKTTLTKQAA